MSDAPPDPKPPPRFDDGMGKSWMLVFFGNLPVPLFLAWLTVSGPGMFGLIAGLAVLYWVGYILCAGRFRVGRSLIQGGTAVALTQLMPVLHFACGAVALRIWEWVSGYRLWGFKDPWPMSDQPALYTLGVFVVVLLTAQPLWIIAILAGSLFRWWAGDTPIWTHPPADPDADPDPTENPAS